MFKSILIVLTLSLTYSSFAQRYVGAKRNRVLKDLNQYILDEKLKASISISDSTIVFMIRDSSYRKSDMWIYFNDQDKCYKQEDYFDCDLCYQKRLKGNLENRHFKWKKLSEAAYLSKRYKILMLFNRQGCGDFIIQYNRVSVSEFNYLLKKVI